MEIEILKKRMALSFLTLLLFGNFLGTYKYSCSFGTINTAYVLSRTDLSRYVLFFFFIPQGGYALSSHVHLSRDLFRYIQVFIFLVSLFLGTLLLFLFLIYMEGAHVSACLCSCLCAWGWDWCQSGSLVMDTTCRNCICTNITDTPSQDKTVSHMITSVHEYLNSENLAGMQ